MVVVANFLKSQDSKSIFEKNLTSIIQAVRPKSKKPVCHDGPCMALQQNPSTGKSLHSKKPLAKSLLRKIPPSKMPPQ